MKVPEPNLGQRASATRDSINQVREEMKKNGYELVEQVFALIIGGILGGQAFQVAQADHHFLIEFLLFLMIFVVGFGLLWMMHFFISLNRSLND